ncbi:MAG: radical SAM protein [Zestosphaera tikiterensis]|uniref:Radical SAM protein n=1 Tax=Zestosphaera tikiterensis TaxID=1973259 RepID=A0A2R7Y2K6_9CREN|nr:MAG: radical SAM protein [Zestosphaera tikiterensis]
MVFEVVITVDRTMMTDHHGKEFLGFMTTGPAVGIPETLWLWIAAPKPEVDDLGRPKVAPYGLRKVEAKLIDLGFNAAVVDPDHINKHLDTMKVLMVGHHDYFAYGPPSSEWWFITGEEPVNRRSFIRFMRSKAVRRAKAKGVKIIAGGPAAWQWLWELDLWKEFGVDTVVDGEAERVVGDLVSKALNGEQLPDYVYVGPHNAPSISEIPLIKGASVNGLVEIMRGCPRGCRFCSVTLRPLRYIPLDFIEKEIKLNVSKGVKSAILHSEDVLLYGADGVKPKPEPLIKLHELVRGLVPGHIAWAHSSLSAVKYAEDNYKLVSKIMNDVLNDKQDYLGVEVGIETGSVNLAKKIMPAKSAPYPPEKWPEVVEDAFRIMHENRIIPAATLILGFPEETPDDVVKTIELLDRLKQYRSLIVPMFFVPMGALKDRDWFRRNAVKHEHVELMIKTLEHSTYWAENIMSEFYVKGFKYAPIKILLKFFIWYVNHKVNSIKPQLEEMLKA